MDNSISNQPNTQPAFNGVHPNNSADNPLANIKTLRETLGANEFMPVPVGTGDKKPYIKDWPRLAVKGVFISAEPDFKNQSTGILCNGLRAVDIDIEDAELANTVRKHVLDKLGNAPVRWRSNSGKHLLLYRSAEGEPKKVKLFNSKKDSEDGGHNIEVLGQGQQFVAFGNHPSGVEYQWDFPPTTYKREQLTTVTEQQIADALDFLRPFIWTENVLLKLCEELATTKKGEGRDDTQNKMAFTMGGYVAGGYIHGERVIEKLYAASVTAGRLENNSEHDLRAHLERSVNEGMSQPLQPPKKEETSHEIINRIVGEEGDAAGQSRIASEAVRRAKGNMRYDHNTQLWYAWNGKVWERDAKHAVTQLVKNLCDEISISLIAQKKNDQAAAVCGIGMINAVVQHMELMDEVLISSALFNTNKTLLTTPDWTIELDGYHKREHRREDYCTKMIAVSPEDVPTSLWDAFMRSAHKEDVAGFLTRWAGYNLTGLTHIRKFVFLYGPTGTGKTIYRETLKGILGDYGAAISKDDITITYGAKNTAGIARTRGARGIFCPEVDDRPLDEATVKALTGEDSVAVKLLYQNPEDFKGEAKLTFSGNHEPTLRNVDDSMRTRFIKVPCLHQPNAAERIDGLLDKLQAEWPGILHKMILALQDVLKGGLQIPVSVEKATDEYFESQDVLKAALEEVCEFENGAWTSLADIHTAVVGEGKKHNNKHLLNLSMKVLSQRLEQDFKLTKHKKKFGQGFYGLKLKGFQSGWQDNKIFDATNIVPEQRAVIWPSMR